MEEELKRFKGYRESLAKYTVDAVALVKDAQDKNTEILIEGANALMLDIDYGTVRRLAYLSILWPATVALRLRQLRSLTQYCSSHTLLHQTRDWAVSSLVLRSIPERFARLLGESGCH